MNEITQVHLGRQAFTISIDAHKALQAYLHAIKRHMGDTDEAVEEVELRMAELLTERGIHGDKVVLVKDVDYLKEQLGKPGDFGDEDDKVDDETDAPKRLFRDTDHAMLAGVSAGIANYVGIDATWVRLAFVALTFAGASGILIYIILWLVIPQAKTTSERLQMHGKPVTVDALKNVVGRADVRGAAERAGTAVGGVVQSVLKVILGIVGAALMIAGVGLLMVLVASSIYFFLNHDAVIPFGIFPLDTAEYVLLAAAIVTICTVGLFLLLAGLTMIKRRSVLPGWAMVVLFALFFSGAAVGTALAASTGPKIDQRYQAAHHSDVRSVAAFTDVNLTGSDHLPRNVGIDRRVSDNYKVEFRYMGHADTRGITVKETKPGHLEVNVSGFKTDPSCSENPCLFAGGELSVIVYAPADKQINITGDDFWSDFPDGSKIPDVPDLPVMPDKSVPAKPVLRN